MKSANKKMEFAQVPHMDAYVALSNVVRPYITRASEARFQSDIVNTDDYGFRLSYDRGGVVDSSSWWGREIRALVLGGSFVFGVGATNDRATLVSQLGLCGRFSFLNLGIRAANSTQELIASIPFLASTERVLICSGLNNLLINLQTLGRYDLYGSLSGEELFLKLEAIDLKLLRVILQKRTVQVSINPLVLAYEVQVRMRKWMARRVGNRKPRAETETQLELTLEEMRARLDQAVAVQARDLRLIVRSCSHNAQVFFALQPFALVSKPDLVSEEEALFHSLTKYGREGKVWRAIKSYLVELWPLYSRELARTCDELGVPYYDLNQRKYEGWCYVDPVHLTDEGYRQVAWYLKEWMDDSPT